MAFVGLLELYAEIAIAIVGFGGLVVALNYSRVSTDPLERIKLSVLIGYGAGGLIWSILPIILLTSGVDERIVWRYLSLTFLSMMLVLAGYRIYQARSATGQARFTGPAFSLIALTQMTLLAVNGYVASGTLFVLALLTNTGIGILVFSQLISVPDDA